MIYTFNLEDTLDPDYRSKLDYPYSYSPITIWKNFKEKENSVLWSDRLFAWNSIKHDELCLKHFGDRGQYWSERDPVKIQAFLADYLDKPNIVLCKVEEQCNIVTGHPVWCFYYKDPDK